MLCIDRQRGGIYYSGQIGGAAHSIQMTVIPELIGQRDQIDRLVVCEKVENSAVYLLMRGFVKIFRG